MNKDNKEIVADFINYICNWVEKGYKDNKEANGYRYPIKNDKLAYLLADKGIEKRIKKQLLKRLGLESIARYVLEPSPNKYPNGDLTIELQEIETDIEFVHLPKENFVLLSKENQEPKEYKAKIIDGETGKVIKEGIWNTKGEFKEDKKNDQAR